ncbi:RluA family pseudouridine synthase [Actimicrobium antarcticum]|uniref:Pseudouridine synthase n=1 Tax=Actimicrobium antarcticum TaxID=1051899 RepID=A0ABP7TRC6_9BURK
MGLAVRLTPPLHETETLIDLDIDEQEELAGGMPVMPPIALDLVPADCGERLDKVVSRMVPQFSRSRMQQWIEDGFVTVDGKVGRTRMTVYGDEHIVILPQAAPEDTAFAPEDIALDIVFEDDAIIVINKPAGLVVHPGAGNWSGTLLNGLLHYWPALIGVPRAGIVHRLDKDTSGLMVVAKTLEVHTDLVRQLQARTVRREYLALVWGTPNLSGTIDAAMGRHPRDRIRMAVLENITAKPAITHFERLESGLLDRRPVSLMRCKLETGRTHQIRVHMQSIGFALVGDSLYGKAHLAPAFHRQALQARRLGLVHPVSGEEVEWQVPLADDFAALIATAGIAEPDFSSAEED